MAEAEATKCSSVGDWELSLDDAINVFEELIEAQNEYFTFGLCLNLKHYVIQSIHLEQHNQKDRLFFVIVEFLKTAPRRTWRVIVDALRVIEFSELAHKVEDKYLASPSQSDISSHQRLSRTAPFTEESFPWSMMDELPDIVSAVDGAQSQSRYLGLKLGLPFNVVEDIHSQYSSPKDRLWEVMSASLRECLLSWRAMACALRSPAVNLPHLAHQVEFLSSKFNSLGSTSPGQETTAIEPPVTAATATPAIAASSSPGRIAADAPEISQRVFRLDEKRGLAVLVTCDYVGTGMTSLNATNTDADEMKTTFEQFDYDIHQLKNGEATKHAVITLLEQISNYLSRYSGGKHNKGGRRKVVIFAFSGHGTSHGTNQDQIKTQDGELLFLMEEVVYPLVRQSAVKRIPKLFIIDACRGSDHLEHRRIGKGVVEVETNYRIDYATIPGHVSFASGNESMWMPQLARLLREEDDTYSNIVDRVNEVVYEQEQVQPEAINRLHVGTLKLYYKQ